MEKRQGSSSPPSPSTPPRPSIIAEEVPLQTPPSHDNGASDGAGVRLHPSSGQAKEKPISDLRVVLPHGPSESQDAVSSGSSSSTGPISSPMAGGVESYYKRSESDEKGWRNVDATDVFGNWYSPTLRESEPLPSESGSMPLDTQVGPGDELGGIDAARLPTVVAPPDNGRTQDEGVAAPNGSPGRNHIRQATPSFPPGALGTSNLAGIQSSSATPTPTPTPGSDYSFDFQTDSGNEGDGWTTPVPGSSEQTPGEEGLEGEAGDKRPTLEDTRSPVANAATAQARRTVKVKGRGKGKASGGAVGGVPGKPSFAWPASPLEPPSDVTPTFLNGRPSFGSASSGSVGSTSSSTMRSISPGVSSSADLASAAQFHASTSFKSEESDNSSLKGSVADSMGGASGSSGSSHTIEGQSDAGQRYARGGVPEVDMGTGVQPWSMNSPISAQPNPASAAPRDEGVPFASSLQSDAKETSDIQASPLRPSPSRVHSAEFDVPASSSDRSTRSMPAKVPVFDSPFTQFAPADFASTQPSGLLTPGFFTTMTPFSENPPGPGETPGESDQSGPAAPAASSTQQMDIPKSTAALPSYYIAAPHPLDVSRTVIPAAQEPEFSSASGAGAASQLSQTTATTSPPPLSPLAQSAPVSSPAPSTTSAIGPGQVAPADVNAQPVWSHSSLLSPLGYRSGSLTEDAIQQEKPVRITRPPPPPLDRAFSAPPPNRLTGLAHPGRSWRRPPHQRLSSFPPPPSSQQWHEAAARKGSLQVQHAGEGASAPSWPMRSSTKAEQQQGIEEAQVEKELAEATVQTLSPTQPQAAVGPSSSLLGSSAPPFPSPSFSSLSSDQSVASCAMESTRPTTVSDGRMQQKDSEANAARKPASLSPLAPVRIGGNTPSSSSSSPLTPDATVLADALQMPISTLLQLIPPHLLDPAHEMLSPCELRLPVSCVGALLEGLRVVNWALGAGVGGSGVGARNASTVQPVIESESSGPGESGVGMDRGNEEEKDTQRGGDVGQEAPKSVNGPLPQVPSTTASTTPAPQPQQSSCDSQPPQPPPLPPYRARNESFDPAELCQRLADALSGIAAQQDIDLVLVRPEHSFEDGRAHISGHRGKDGREEGQGNVDAGEAGLAQQTNLLDSLMGHTSVRGDEGAVRFVLSHILQKVLDSAAPGACVGLGVRVEEMEPGAKQRRKENGVVNGEEKSAAAGDEDGVSAASPPTSKARDSEQDEKDKLLCAFEIKHDFSSKVVSAAAAAAEHADEDEGGASAPASTSTLSAMTASNFMDDPTTRSILVRWDATLDVAPSISEQSPFGVPSLSSHSSSSSDRSPPNHLPYLHTGSRYLLSFVLGKGAPLSVLSNVSEEEEAARQRFFPALTVSREPTLDELVAFTDRLRGKRVALHAAIRNTFTKCLTGYFTSWGLDVTPFPVVSDKLIGLSTADAATAVGDQGRTGTEAAKREKGSSESAANAAPTVAVALTAGRPMLVSLPSDPRLRGAGIPATSETGASSSSSATIVLDPITGTATVIDSPEQASGVADHTDTAKRHGGTLTVAGDAVQDPKPAAGHSSNDFPFPPSIAPIDFVVIDDDVETLQRQLLQFRSAMPLLQASLMSSTPGRGVASPNERQENSGTPSGTPSLSPQGFLARRPTLPSQRGSAESLRPADSVGGGSRTSELSNRYHQRGSEARAAVAVIHFTNLANYKHVKDIVHSILDSAPPGMPMPEVLVVPKPAGPRRCLTALYTASTKPVVDPYFLPIANSPVVPAGHYFLAGVAPELAGAVSPEADLEHPFSVPSQQSRSTEKEETPATAKHLITVQEDPEGTGHNGSAVGFESLHEEEKHATASPTVSNSNAGHSASVEASATTSAERGSASHSAASLQLASPPPERATASASEPPATTQSLLAPAPFSPSGTSTPNSPVPVDALEYFSETATRIGSSAAAGMVIQSPDGRPAGIFFQPQTKPILHRRDTSGSWPTAGIKEGKMSGESSERNQTTKPAVNRSPTASRSHPPGALFAPQVGLGNVLAGAGSPKGIPLGKHHSSMSTSGEEAGQQESVSFPPPPANTKRTWSNSLSNASLISAGAKSRRDSDGKELSPASALGAGISDTGSSSSQPAAALPDVGLAEAAESPHRPNPRVNTSSRAPPGPSLGAPESPRRFGVAGTRGKPPSAEKQSGMLIGAGFTAVSKKGAPAKKKSVNDGVIPSINVLIVEDNEINQTILSMFMKKKGIRFSVASNGVEAVEKWRTGGFHLILMDIQLPVMDGIEATKEIRRLEKSNNIGIFPSTPPSEIGSPAAGDTGTPASSTSAATSSSSAGGGSPRSNPASPFRSSVIIVALTASVFASDRVAALAAGCNDFLTKPVSLPWLERKITEWGCMQALIDFEGWKRWKNVHPKNDASRSSGEIARGFGSGPDANARALASRLHIQRSGDKVKRSEEAAVGEATDSRPRSPLRTASLPLSDPTAPSVTIRASTPEHVDGGPMEKSVSTETVRGEMGSLDAPTLTAVRNATNPVPSASAAVPSSPLATVPPNTSNAAKREDEEEGSGSSAAVEADAASAEAPAPTTTEPLPPRRPGLVIGGPGRSLSSKSIEQVLMGTSSVGEKPRPTTDIRPQEEP